MTIVIDSNNYNCASVQVNYQRDGTKMVEINFADADLNALVEQFINKKNISIIIENDTYSSLNFINASKTYGTGQLRNGVSVFFSDIITE